MAHGHGGARAGAGQNKGPMAVTIERRKLYEKHMAKEGRELNRLINKTKASGDQIPTLPPGDAEASVAWSIRNLMRLALKGSEKAAIHLDERLGGRTPYQVGLGGDPEAPPIQHAVIKDYVCSLEDGTPVPAPTLPLSTGPPAEHRKRARRRKRNTDR
jgi:hypothetical protein